MNRDEIWEEIKNLKDKAQRPPISTQKIEEAMRISISNIYTTKDLFSILCALNLLNAAIKMSYYRNDIKYSFIKGHVSRIANYLIPLNLQEQFNTQIYITDKWVAYIEVFNFCFSFHNISPNEKLEEYKNSDDNRHFEWEGVRLQMIAEDLFDFSQRLSKEEVEEFIGALV